MKIEYRRFPSLQFDAFLVALLMLNLIFYILGMSLI